MVHDPVRGKTVMFGGWQAGTALADTWEWDGEDWEQKFPVAVPPARWHAAACWDPIRARVVMFGGASPGTTYYGDTWEWDGLDWTLVATGGPSPRAQPGMAFDHLHGRVTLIGGENRGRFRDMWALSGGVWSPVPSGTMPRPAHGMVFCSDPERRQILWNGGWDGGHINETWIWDGVSWTRAQSDRGGYTDCAAAYDPVRRRIVVFGGNISDHTWEWTGSVWLRREMWLRPAGRSRPAIAFDSVEGRMLLFGGDLGSNRPQSDTWELFHFTPAASNPYGTGCVSSRGTVPQLATVGDPLPWIDETWRLELTGIPGTPSNAVFGLIGSSDRNLNGLPLLPLDLTLIGAPGCFMLTNGDDDAVTLVNRGGSATWDIAFPLDLRLVGSWTYLQAVVFDARQNPLGLVVSNAVAGRIGMK